MYFRASDNNYDRYGHYFPDTTDLSRKGLGIILDVRVMAWSQILVQDALFLLFNVKNDGTKPLDKVGVTIAWADFVGGEGPDNLSEFDLLNDIAWSRNADNRSPNPAFGSDPVGIVAGAFLETPGNAVDRIDNDADGEMLGPKVTEEMLVGESDPTISRFDVIRYDGIDNNGNGLIDENTTHIAFQDQLGVAYADRIDQNNNSELGSPVVSQEMVNQSAGDMWKRWPASPETDEIQDSAVHLILVEADDIGNAFSDFVLDSDDSTWAVVEVSSFQLETIDTFHPQVVIRVFPHCGCLDTHDRVQVGRRACRRCRLVHRLDRFGLAVDLFRRWRRP